MRTQPISSLAETIQLDSAEEARALAGTKDRHLRQVRDALDVRITMRGEVLIVQGPEERVKEARCALDDLRHMVQEGGRLREEDVDAAIAAARAGEATQDLAISVFTPGRDVRPRSEGQAEYVNAIQAMDLTISTGPAGTGKTYLAVAMAVSALKQRLVRRIILTRPAIEAGERLGFLPGDLQTKIHPYLRPLYDALGDMMDPRMIKRYVEDGVLEVAPIAYMRGRTLDHSFIILDEGQNCTTGQMKMFLTRLGQESRTVVTGDLSQVDLPSSQTSGLLEAMEILRGLKGIAFVRLQQRDIVRHRLVQDIVDAYERHERHVKGIEEEDRNERSDGRNR